MNSCKSNLPNIKERVLQVELGGVYELVITNLAGLCRYRFGDVVQVSGFHKQAPQVSFLYRCVFSSSLSVSIFDLNDLEMNVFRQGQFLNVRGEKTSEQTFYYTLTTTASDIWREDDVTLRDYCCVESGIAADLLSKCAHPAIILSQLFKYACTYINIKYVTNSSF